LFVDKDEKRFMIIAIISGILALYCQHLLSRYLYFGATLLQVFQDSSMFTELTKLISQNISEYICLLNRIQDPLGFFITYCLTLGLSISFFICFSLSLFFRKVHFIFTEISEILNYI